MTVEPPLAEQQRAVVEFYTQSRWIKANLTLEDDNLYLEYSYDKRDSTMFNSEQSFHHRTSTTFNNGSNIYDLPDTITSQKRFVKITKPDNTGLGN